MKLLSAGWLLLIIFTDSGLVKHGGEHDSREDCVAAWNGIAQCFAKLAKKEISQGKKGCTIYCGQPIGFCLQAERLLAPGVIFPLPEKEATCD